jgi:hypothetical protein
MGTLILRERLFHFFYLVYKNTYIQLHEKSQSMYKYIKSFLCSIVPNGSDIFPQILQSRHNLSLHKCLQLRYLFIEAIKFRPLLHLLTLINPF